MTPPNMVTLFRIATAPFLIWILMHTSPSASWLAAGVFFIATISDFFDGYLARSYDYVTTLGKFLDPMADKLVVMTALIMLAAGAPGGWIVPAEELGKYKMALQAIAIHGLLIHYTYFHVDCFAAGMFILWLAMAVSVWSGVDYYVRVVRELRPK